MKRNWRYKPENFPVGSTVYVQSGSWVPSISRYVVEKITPTGQVVASRQVREDYRDTIRITPRGGIVGEAGRWSRIVVSEEHAVDCEAENKAREAWSAVHGLCDDLTKAARQGDAQKALVLFRSLASAIEAATAGETAQTGSTEGESAVGEAETPNLSPGH